MAKKSIGANKLSDYAEKVDTMDKDKYEFVRGELARLGDWICDNTQLKDHREIRKFLKELVDIST